MPRVIITVPDKNAQPYRFQLDRKVVSLGRGSDNDIVIDSGSVSGKHAEMHRVEGGYELSDSGSTNGIKSNGVRESVVELRSGMAVKLGDVAFDFSLTDEEMAILAAEKTMGDSPVSMEPEFAGPARLPGSAPRPAPVVETEPEPVLHRRADAEASGGGGIGMISLFVILAAAAFCIGLGVRYQKDTGESLIEAVSNRGKAEKTAPPAEEE